MTISWANGAAIFGSTDLNSLASSSTLASGWQSAVQTCTTDKDVISGKITSGSSAPTAGTLEVWCVPVYDVAGTDTYPDSFSSASASRSVGYRNAIINEAYLIASFQVDTTASRPYEFTNKDLSVICGEQPKKYVIWVTHNTVSALTGGQCWKTGVTY